jgi:hypothetical protein
MVGLRQSMKMIKWTGWKHQIVKETSFQNIVLFLRRLCSLGDGSSNTGTKLKMRLGYIGTITDITDRKIAEAILREKHYQKR